MSVITLELDSRELDVIIDGLIYRHESLTDIQPFSLNPLAIKLRLKELVKLLLKCRIVRDEKNGKI